MAMPQDLPRPMLRADIQALRAVAVMGVVIFHLNSAWLPGGYLGVDVFFVISGYLISKIVINGGNTFSWLNFYSSRIRRIVPAYALMLLIVSLLSAILLVPTDFASFTQSFRSALFFTSNTYFASAGDYFSSAAHEWPLLHTWSLAVEMQFYLLLPLALRLIPQKLAPTVVGCFLLAGLAVTQSLWIGSTDTAAHYYSTLFRAHEFLFGTWLAALALNNHQHNSSATKAIRAVGLVLIVGSMALIDRSKFSPLMAAIPCLGAALVIATNNTFTQGGWLSSKSLVAIGAISYSLYLWHWPFIALGKYVYGDGSFGLMLTGLIVAAFFSTSYLSWRFVERPFTSVSNFRHKLRLVLLFGFACLPALAANDINSTLTPNASVDLLRYAPPNTFCHGNTNVDCLRGDRRQEPSILLIGDSHAAQLNLFMEKFGERYGVSSLVMSASSCLPINGFSDARLPAWALEPCKSMGAAVERQLPHFEKLIIAGKWSYHASNPLFVDFFSKFLQSNALKEKQVFILGQIPMLDRHPVRSLRFSHLGLDLAVNSNMLASSANNLIISSSIGVPNVTVLDFSSHEIFESAPLFKGQILYMDTHHLNEIGSVRYSEEIAPAFAASLNILPIRNR